MRVDVLPQQFLSDRICIGFIDNFSSFHLLDPETLDVTNVPVQQSQRNAKCFNLMQGDVETSKAQRGPADVMQVLHSNKDVITQRFPNGVALYNSGFTFVEQIATVSLD